MTTTPSALALWWKRLAKRERGEDASRPGSWRLDDLWRAACLESNARDARRQGLVIAEQEWTLKLAALRNEAAAAQRREARAALRREAVAQEGARDAAA